MSTAEAFTAAVNAIAAAEADNATIILESSITLSAPFAGIQDKSIALQSSGNNSYSLNMATSLIGGSPWAISWFLLIRVTLFMLMAIALKQRLTLQVKLKHCMAGR